MNGDYQSLAPELRENLKMLAENRLCQTPEEVRELLEVNDKGQVKNAMQTKDHNDWIASLTENMTAEEGPGMKYVG